MSVSPTPPSPGRNGLPDPTPTSAPLGAPPHRECRWAAVLSAGLVALVLLPVLENFQEDPYDGFPLSYYPMFSHARDPDYPVQHLLGRAPDGTYAPLSYKLAGTGGFNQVRRQIRGAVRDGRAAELCTYVAERAAARGEAVSEVRVVTGTYRLDRFFVGEKAPIAEEVHAVCPVPRAVAARR